MGRKPKSAGADDSALAEVLKELRAIRDEFSERMVGVEEGQRKLEKRMGRTEEMLRGWAEEAKRAARKRTEAEDEEEEDEDDEEDDEESHRKKVKEGKK